MSPTIEIVHEERAAGEVPLWRHPEWLERLPWLVQGTTGAGDEAFDLGLFGTQPVGDAMRRWRLVTGELRMRGAVHAMQVHGGEVHRHSAAHEGLLVQHGYDGHLTRVRGLLLTVSIADCVPLFLVDEVTRALALVHAGWRGVAADIAERALEMLVEEGSDPADIRAHCGPAICGECYEVGPEVHRGVHPDRTPPDAPTPIDLRAALGERLVRRGVPVGSITVSGHCTRCGPGEFFSHRGGSAARQMGVLGRLE